MTSDRGTVCFTCGEVTGDPPRLNRLQDGSVCPGCRVRIEESLPPLLPGFGRGLPEGYAAPEEIHAAILTEAKLGPWFRAPQDEESEGPAGA